MTYDRMNFDLIVTNGVVVSGGSFIYPPNSDIGVEGETIKCIGDLSAFKGNCGNIIDAHGGFVTPGGIDSHCHLSQGAGGITGDNFESGTRSAIAGGTTTVLCFAAQDRQDTSVCEVIADYHLKAEGVCFSDYSFHLMVTNPTDNIMDNELPSVFKSGITSVKIYMSYDNRKLSDDQIMEVMSRTRSLGMTTMIHAENWDMITYIIKHLKKRGHTEPYYHAESRPPLVEDEAAYRAICISELMDTPILLVHVSSKGATDNIRKAQTRLLPILAETCPQYLYLLSDKLKEPDFEGAKYVCSPPLRDNFGEIDALWEGIANGTFTTLSSDHCPSKFNHPLGKRLGLINGIPLFTEIPNGLPGVETRMALGYQGVLDKRISMHKFVEVACTNPAMLYGLEKKGVLGAGYDADIVIWYPDNVFSSYTITNSDLHHSVDYTPFEGMNVGNWPRYTILRGKVVWDRDGQGIVACPGQGKFIRRVGNRLAKPRGDSMVNIY